MVGARVVSSSSAEPMAASKVSRSPAPQQHGVQSNVLGTQERYCCAGAAVEWQRLGRRPACPRARAMMMDISPNPPPFRSRSTVLCSHALPLLFPHRMPGRRRSSNRAGLARRLNFHDPPGRAIRQCGARARRASYRRGPGSGHRAAACTTISRGGAPTRNGPAKGSAGPAVTLPFPAPTAAGLRVTARRRARSMSSLVFASHALRCAVPAGPTRAFPAGVSSTSPYPLRAGPWPVWALFAPFLRPMM